MQLLKFLLVIRRTGRLYTALPCTRFNSWIKVLQLLSLNGDAHVPIRNAHSLVAAGTWVIAREVEDSLGKIAVTLFRGCDPKN
jgi:hypothetical protein